MLRRSLRPTAALSLALAAGFVAVSYPAAGQEEEVPNPKPPAKKVVPAEEEEGPARPPKPVPVGDDPAGPGKPTAAVGGGGPYLVKLDDVARAAAAAADPAVKQYLAAFTVAFDRVTDTKGKVFRATPVALLWGKDKYPPPPDGFGLSPLTDDNQPGEVQTYQVRQVRRVEPFEAVALAETDQFLKAAGTPRPDGPGPPADKLAAAERVLTAVLFFHDAAREQNKRRGKSWDPLKAAVYDKLTAVRVDRVRQAAADRDWPLLKELAARLTELYKANPKVQEQVAAARLAEAEDLVKSDKLADLERGRELVVDYEGRFPAASNDTAKRVRKALADRAKKYLADAERMAGQNQSEARNLLKTAEAIDPDSPGLAGLQGQLKAGYAVLVVGTRRPPERMSPALARSDSERQAVELMFEGLTEAVPDEQVGVRFEPVLAAGRPRVGAGVRDVTLVRSAGWADPAAGKLSADDVTGTLRLFRQRPLSWAAEPAAWFDDPGADPADPAVVRLRFRAGHPDPRSLLTFKVHPARWLLQNNKTVEDPEFARRPFGTGPFKLAPAGTKAGDPRDVVFVADPAYGRRPGRAGQPFIQEIRLTDVTEAKDLAAELRAGRVHVLTDVPTADLPKFTANNGLNGRVRVVTPAVDRRVHVLAVNHHRPALQNPDVRRGLSHAIDRDRVLTEVFRAGSADAHRPLAGPFPPGCWAAARPLGAAPPPLFNQDLAQAKFRQYLDSPGASPLLRLAYPDDDPLAKAACERIKGMVDGANGTNDRKLTLALEPYPPRELVRRVEDEHDFDLAYLPFDYRDDWYPLALGSFLDPAAVGAGGRNYCGYRAKEVPPTEDDVRLGGLLAEARLHRDPGVLVPLAHDIDRQFNRAVPFVPLWQLDRHLVISTAVKVWLDGQPDEASPRLLDPTTLFNSVGRWRVE